MKKRKYKVSYLGIENKIIALFLIISVFAYMFFSIPNLFRNSSVIRNFIIITNILIAIFLILNSSFSPIKIMRIKSKLKRVIKINNLYVLKNEKSGLVTSLNFKFFVDKKCLYIEAYPNGIDLISKLKKLGKILETTLNLELIDSSNNSPACYTYIFTLQKPARLKVNLDTFNQMTKGFIKLDSDKEWDFNKYPHGIVAGKTGGGKTYFLYYLILCFLKQEAHVYIGDPKEKDLFSLKEFVGKENVESSPNGIAKILRTMYEEMARRNEVMTSHGIEDFGKDYRDYNLQPIVGFFDELSVLKSENPKISAEIDLLLNKVVSKGRQYGVFVILATQRPDATTINTNVRDQLSLRVALGKLYREGLKMTLGDDYDELPSGEQGQGKGFIYIDGLSWSMPRSFQSPFFSNNEIDLFKQVTSKEKNN